MTLRRCAGCFATIEGRSNRRFCSAACNQKAHRQRCRAVTNAVTGQGPVPSIIRGTNGVLLAAVARCGWLGDPEGEHR
jgi:hypothetical protein